MGTQAELDELERALDEKCKEFDKIDDEYNRLVTAQTNMDALYDEFKNYKKQIEDALDSYNEDGNQWVGAFYDEMEKAEDSIDSCIEKFEGTKDDLDYKVSDRYDQMANAMIESF